MKKLLALMVALTLSLTVLSGALADTLGLGIVTNFGSHNKNATADADGVGEINSSICAVTVDATGVITSVYFDVAQTSATFNAKGELTVDPAAAKPSKIEKQDAYGMKSASGIGKEWFEQAAALQTFCVGKTLEQVLAGVSEDKDTAVAEDLKAGATIGLADLIGALEKAYAQAYPAK